jgi:hypothetical protein
MIIPLQVAAATAANKPGVKTANASGRLVAVTSATANFGLNIVCQKHTENFDVVREGFRIPIEKEWGQLIRVEAINASTTDQLDCEIVTAPTPGVTIEAGNRVPPTALKCSGQINLTDPGDPRVEYDGVRNGRRRKQIIVQLLTAGALVNITNDGNAGYRLSDSSPTWTMETDANITVELNAGTAAAALYVMETFLK